MSSALSYIVHPPTVNVTLFTHPPPVRAAMVDRIGPYNEVVRVVSNAVRPVADDGELLVQVLACGLAFPDVLVIEGKHMMKRAPPFSPAGEVCGTIVEIGDGVEGFAVGDKVFGAAISGGLAELTRIPSHTCYKLPEGVDPILAAGFELNYGTSWHGIVDIARLQAGETMLVLGASGGVGMAAIDIGRSIGANVVACASTEAKLQACIEQGADETINYSDDDGTTFKEKLKAAGIYGDIDVVFDPVGGTLSEPAMRGLGWGGRHLVIGFAAGGDTPTDAIPKLPINLALLNERAIQGGQCKKKSPFGTTLECRPETVATIQ